MFLCFVTALYIFQCVKGLTVVRGRRSPKNLHRLQHEHLARMTLSTKDSTRAVLL